MNGPFRSRAKELDLNSARLSRDKNPRGTGLSSWEVSSQLLIRVTRGSVQLFQDAGGRASGDPIYERELRSYIQGRSRNKSATKQAETTDDLLFCSKGAVVLT